MPVLITPVGHPTIKLSAIAPSNSAAFSPNLHRWMKSRGHIYRGGGFADTVYRIRPETELARVYGAGTLMIGSPYNQYEGDTDFSGSMLMAALCVGAGAGRFCYIGAMLDLDEVPGFWDRYLEVGRCAIDPDHEEFFIGGDRYSRSGQTRTCLWCGEVHEEA